MIEVKKTPLKLISEGNHTNKRKSPLTSLVTCFILGKVYCRTYWRGYAYGLRTSPPDRFDKVC